MKTGDKVKFHDWYGTVAMVFHDGRIRAVDDRGTSVFASAGEFTPVEKLTMKLRLGARFFLGDNCIASATATTGLHVDDIMLLFDCKQDAAGNWTHNGQFVEIEFE